MYIVQCIHHTYFSKIQFRANLFVSFFVCRQSFRMYNIFFARLPLSLYLTQYYFLLSELCVSNDTFYTLCILFILTTIQIANFVFVSLSLSIQSSTHSTTVHRAAMQTNKKLTFATHERLKVYVIVAKYFNISNRKQIQFALFRSISVVPHCHNLGLM